MDSSGRLCFPQILSDNAGAGFDEILFRFREAAGEIAFDIEFGSQFILVMPFTATQGSISAVASVSVVLKNSTGASPVSSATF